MMLPWQSIFLDGKRKYITIFDGALILGNYSGGIVTAIDIYDFTVVDILQKLSSEDTGQDLKISNKCNITSI